MLLILQNIEYEWACLSRNSEIYFDYDRHIQDAWIVMGKQMKCK